MQMSETKFVHARGEKSHFEKELQYSLIKQSRSKTKAILILRYMNKYPTNSRCCLLALSSAFARACEKMLYVIYLLTSFITPPDYLTLFIGSPHTTLCPSFFIVRKGMRGGSPFP